MKSSPRWLRLPSAGARACLCGESCVRWTLAVNAVRGRSASALGGYHHQVKRVARRYPALARRSSLLSVAGLPFAPTGHYQPDASALPARCSGDASALPSYSHGILIPFLPKPFQPSNLAILARLFELLDCVDSQLVIRGLDLLPAQSGDFEHCD